MKQILLWTVATMLCGLTTWGQGLDPECPGFRNPTNFSTGSSYYYWTARVGERTYTPGNTSDTTTGYHIMSTCTSTPDITGHANIMSASLHSGSDNAITQCSHNFFDANDSRFQIIGPGNAGIDQFTVAPGSATGMPRIPPGYTHSVRLGDMRNTGQAQATGNISNSTGKRGAEALFYTMYVTPLNALLFINYAVVARRYSHTAYDAGEFLIRVVKQNADGSWPNAPINDSMWYKVSAPNFNGAELPMGWEVGAGDVNNWPCTYAYKPWAKVAISLTKYIYQNIRIEMYTSDCIYSADPIYAYICGDFQSMRIDTSGCANAESDAVTTLNAPSGMLSYQWFVATNGFEMDINNSYHMDSVPFRPVTGLLDSNTYSPTLADFVLTQGPDAGDTIPQQTFMCVMTSALDPHKPFTSKVYANVSNNKPIPYVSFVSDCNLSVQLSEESVIYNENSIDNDSTRWIIYSDTLCTTVLDTLWGQHVSYRFPTDGYYKVNMRVTVAGRDCGATTTVVVRALQEHPAAIELEEAIVCEGERAEVRCTSQCHLEKVWHIGDSTLRSSPGNPLDTIRWWPQLGSTYITLTTTTDSLCPATSDITLTALGNTTVTSDADGSILCLGDSTLLSASGISQPLWFSNPYDSLLADGGGREQVYVSPQVTTTYMVQPSQQTRCLQNASAITIVVLPYPEPTIWTSRPVLDLTDPTLTLEDRSPYSTSSHWLFSDGLTATGNHITHTFGTSSDSVSITLNACNEERCCADTTVSLPVTVTTFWLPNTFTPGEAINNRFSYVSTLDIITFELHIYNRNGLLVYHSTDLQPQWDGNDQHGTPCPQGAYVYHYSYTEATEPDRLHQGQGTLTLLR
ncbi:MAG: gliding motility-associated C-terminal domain-containing protein [Bacteroidales bacterium]|nr:gliding motility-associated C-terminal domain-containing protein [Bacteroidales bacterium]